MVSNQQPHLALLFFQRKLRKQIGNPEGEEKPNKKYYDPRACIRSAEDSTVKRMEQCFEDLRCVNVLGLGPPDSWRQVGKIRLLAESGAIRFPFRV